MIRIENPYGVIQISHNYFANLVGNAASSCFGVAEMANSSPAQELRTLVNKKDFPDKGVRVRAEDGALLIDLHIVVTFGINIPAITSSIVNKVTYTVENATGLNVKKVNVYVDGLKSE